MIPLLIGNYDLGATENLKPFMIPEKAFQNLINAYVFRGRVQRKTGYYKLGRLRRVLTAAAAGSYSTINGQNTLNLVSALSLEASSQIALGSVSTITITFGAPISQTLMVATATSTLTVGGVGPITSASINYSTGIITINANAVAGPASVTVSLSYYPTLPVMGLRTYERINRNNERTIEFDTRYAYEYNGAQFIELPSTLPTTWSGTDADFFWSTNYYQDTANNDIFWVTNNTPGFHGFALTNFTNAVAGPPSTIDVTAAGNTFQVGDTVFFVDITGASANNNLSGTVTAAGATFTVSNPGTNIFTNGISTGWVFSPNRNVNGDGLRYYNGTTWANANPAVNQINVVKGCLICIPYKDRLVLLNTIEGNAAGAQTRFPQRARWSQNGTPLDFSQGWRDDVVGRGGFFDAPTNEVIVSCGFIKDQLIVYFERSTWVLAYTGNEILPFVWQKIDNELGSESTFSVTTFDNGLIAMGNVGIHIANGNSVNRIDQDIPSTVFQIQNLNQGPERIYAIRDFYKELIYFSYPYTPDSTTPRADFKYPNRMVVYNYRNNTFSFFDDHFTCFGYYQKSTGYTWATLPYDSWASWSDAWNSGSSQALFPDIMAGNQQGYVFSFDPNKNSNDFALTITGFSGNTITSAQHNLAVGRYIYIDNCLGLTGINGQIREIIATTTNTITIDGIAPTGTYTGGGEIKPLSNFIIQTKQFTPFWKIGHRFNLVSIDYLLDRTSVGRIIGNIFLSMGTNYSFSDSASNPSILGDNSISTAPEPGIIGQNLQDQIWHKQFAYCEGDTFQIQLTLNDDQMRDLVINESDVTLHGMLFIFDEGARFL